MKVTSDTENMERVRTVMIEDGPVIPIARYNRDIPFKADKIIARWLVQGDPEPSRVEVSGWRVNADGGKGIARYAKVFRPGDELPEWIREVIK